MNTKIAISIALAFLSVYSSFAQGGSVLDFPRLSFETGTITGVAVVNPGQEAAEVTFTAYNADGSLLEGSGVTNPATRTILANRQFSQIATQLFGSGADPETIAWFQVTSASPDLTGFFLFLNNDIDFFDGSDVPPRSQRIIFPEVRLGADTSTELNILNPGDAPATMTLSLLDGVSNVTEDLAIPAKGVARLDAAEFFGISSSVLQRGSEESAVYVEVSSDVEIAGFAFVRGNGDLLGSTARPADERLNTLFFPQLAVLGGISTTLVLENLSDEDIVIGVTAHEPTGRLYEPPDVRENPVNRVLSAGSTLRVDLAQFFGFTGDTSREGWLEVTASEQAITGVVSYEIPSVGSLASVAGLAEGNQRALFSHLATSIGFFTGVAVLNTGSLAANIRILAMDADGTVLGTFSSLLPPGQRISRLISDVIPNAAEKAGGLIWISSDLPVYLTSLFGSVNNGVLANIPPQPAPLSFQPDAGTPRVEISPPLAILSPSSNQKFTISGTAATPVWRINGVDGGSAVLGTVASDGTFTAPATVPSDLPLVVTADFDGELAGASIDVLARNELLGDLGLVQSVAYLEGTQRLYTAELTVFSTSEASARTSRPQQALDSRIFDVTDGTSQTIASFPGDEISKMLGFQALGGDEYLLVTGSTSGTLRRVDPATGIVKLLVSGLNQPGSMAIDPVSGDLLVAETGMVSRVPVAVLNVGLLPTTAESTVPPVRRGVAFLDAVITGIAVDPCTGNLFLSDSEGDRILEFDRITGEVIRSFEDIENPGQQLALQRARVNCPFSLHLLFVERDRDQVTLLVPATGLTSPWSQGGAPADLTLLPADNPFQPDTSGVLLADVVDGSGAINLVQTPDLYQQTAINPPMLPDLIGQEGISSYSFTAEILSADPSTGLSFGDSITGRFYWDNLIELVFSQGGANIAFYSSDDPAAGAIEVDLNGGVLRSVITPDGPLQIAVTDSFNGEGLDFFQLVISNGDAGFSVQFVDESGSLLSSLGLPSNLFIPPAGGPNSTLLLITDPAAQSGQLLLAHLTSIHRTN